MNMGMFPVLTLKQDLKLNQILSGGQLRIFCNILEMTNSELLVYLKDGEGKGQEGKYPMFSLDKFMSIQHKTDVVVKGGIIYETSNDFIRYSSDGGGQTKNPCGTYGSLAWMLKKRGEIIRVASAFFLHYHHGFFWKKEPLRPVSMMGAVEYINQRMELFSLERPACYSLFTRAAKNKAVQVEGKEYQLRSFFTRKKHNAELTKEWLTKVVSSHIVNGKGILTDENLTDKFLENFGFSLARRTISKMRKQLGLVSSYGKKITR